MRQAIRERNPRRFVRKVWPWVLVVLVAMFLVWRTEQAAHTANETSQNLRAGLIASCEDNGNPLRVAVRGILKEGITAPNDPRLRELLPNVPQEVIERIAKEGNRKKHHALAQIQEVNCVTQYEGH